MQRMLQQLMALGPVFFGVFLFAPMWAAALDALQITLPLGIQNLHAMLALGLAWGLAALVRGRWL